MLLPSLALVFLVMLVWVDATLLCKSTMERKMLHPSQQEKARQRSFTRGKSPWQLIVTVLMVVFYFLYPSLIQQIANINNCDTYEFDGPGKGWLALCRVPYLMPCVLRHQTMRLDAHRQHDHACEQATTQVGMCWYCRLVAWSYCRMIVLLQGRMVVGREPAPALPCLYCTVFFCVMPIFTSGDAVRLLAADLSINCGSEHYTTNQVFLSTWGCGCLQGFVCA